MLIKSSSDEQTQKSYQPGGTCMIMQNNVLGTIDKYDSDKRGLGRWTYFIIQGKNNKKVAFITAYRVSQNSVPGDDTVYAQQYRLLRRQNIMNPKPKKVFDDDLCQLLTDWKNANIDIVLMIDANAEITDKQLQKISQSAQLYDIMSSRHGMNCPRTYVRGNKRIDYILGTKNIVNAISKCGILAFNTGIISDHRALWLDLEINVLLKQHLPSMYKHPITMNSKNIPWSKNARKKTGAHLERCKVQQKISQLHTNIDNDTMRAENIANLEQIDNDIHHAMIAGVKSYQKYYTWWSPALHQALLVKQYWTLKQIETKHHICMSNQIQEVLRKLPEEICNGIITNHAAINTRIRQSQQQVREIRKNDRHHRNLFLQAQQIKHHMKNDNASAKIVCNMQKAEMMPIINKKIRAYLNSKFMQAPTYLDIDTSEGHKRITTQQDIENTLLEHHKQHFSQASDTPLAQKQVVDRFGISTDTKHSQQFRAGSKQELQYWDNPKIKAFMKCLMTQPDDPPEIDTTLSVADIKQGFKIWRERTSTSPSGRKLPLYKIWLQSHNDENGLTTDQFFQIITDVINLSRKLQYPLKRWLTVYNLFVCKEKGVYKPTRLRPLHNIEAEVNLIRRELISRRLIRNAESYGMIPMNNCGGRKGKTALDVVMLKYLTIGICHMQRRDFAITDCDAKACYDRVLPHVLYLCYSKMGLPSQDCVWLARILTQMKYHMLTKHGPSEKNHSRTIRRYSMVWDKELQMLPQSGF